MNYLYALLMGLIQGLTEFLPVSSSGHLALFSSLFGLKSAEETSLLLEVLLHFGTLIAVCIYYWRDIKDMIVEFFGWLGDIFGGRQRRKAEPPRPARRQIFLLVVATLPLLLVLPFQDKVEGMSAIPWMVGAALILTGFILFVADKIVAGKKNAATAGWKDALFVGVAQVVAVLPGISRSGTTISAGLSRGLDRSFAVKLSFLMSIPTVLGAVLLKLIDLFKVGIDPSLVLPYLFGMAVSAVSGYFAIGLVRFIIKKGKFGGFAYYCWIVGAVSIIVSLI
jgi:undecaprenyl-diphosphatase